MLHLIALLLCCFLFTGCTAETAPVPQMPPEPTAPAALYDPGSPMELRYPGALRTYPLPMEDILGICTIGRDLLVFSGYSSTTLALLSGDDLRIRASIQLDHLLAPEDPSLHIDRDGLSFFDPNTRETVLFSAGLEEKKRIAAPRDMVGTPIASSDGSQLFYCTPHAIRVWDLSTGIRRMLKEISFPSQNLTGLHRSDTILECTVTDENSNVRTMLLSPKDGKLLYAYRGFLHLRSGKDYCYAALPTGMTQLLLFGNGLASPQVLTAQRLNDGQCWFLEDGHGAVMVPTGSGQETAVSYYDLTTGLRTSGLTLECTAPLSVAGAGDGYVYLLVYDESYGSDVLYRWEISALPSGDKQIYTTPYTPDQPDLEGLDRCRDYARDISARYGIEVLVGREAADAHPWDYDFTEETFAPFLWQELELLDESLSHYPKGLLEDTLSHFSGMKICLVGRITGTPESGSLETANGLQFLDGTDTCLALATGPRSDQALYHELFHVMETRLLSNSTAFDQWDNLNPPGFTYAYSYDGSSDPNRTRHCQGENRSFIDAYSMSFPKEDRARIMEYAMIPGNAELFRCPVLQAKLTALCTGIRQAYGLKKSPETFLWEQYLAVPMAYAD